MIRLFFVLTVLAPFGSFAQTTSSVDLPFDPVMGLTFQPAQIAFALAPKDLVAACTEPSRSQFWIYAQTRRPEGDYMVIAGPVWTVLDTPKPSPPVLDPVDAFGQVILVRNAACKSVGSPDTMFNAPEANQAGIVNDLAIDLIGRAAQAYGGKVELLAALNAQGLTAEKLPLILRPLVADLARR
jgi:hypothetical protein